jgi:hypothetical protein
VVKKITILRRLKKKGPSSFVCLKRFLKGFLINSQNQNLLLRKELWREERYLLSIWKESKLLLMKRIKSFKKDLRSNRGSKHWKKSWQAVKEHQYRLIHLNRIKARVLILKMTLHRCYHLKATLMNQMMKTCLMMNPKFNKLINQLKELHLKIMRYNR